MKLVRSIRYTKKRKNQSTHTEGSIARGKYIYPLSDTEYVKAATAITNPFIFTNDEIQESGKHLYTVNCAVCHGDKGDGQGHLVQINKFPPPPSYLMEPLLSKPDGQRYHSLIYGRNLMGSYASQLNHRRKVAGTGICKKLQGTAQPTGISYSNGFNHN